MLNNKLLLARSLAFAATAAVISACSGGSISQSALPPQTLDNSGRKAPKSTATLPGYPTVQQTRNGGGACSSSNVVTLGAQPAAGDLVLIYVQVNNTSAKLTAPSGFSTKDTKTGSWFQAAEYYKIATGSEGTSFTVPSTCSGKAITWIAADIKGEDASAPFDKHNMSVDSSTGISTFTTASLTPSHANDLPVSVIAPGSNSLSVSSFSPSTWTLGATGAYYTQKFYSGPATGTSPVSFSETTSAATRWASLETIDLINPAPSATPAPVQTSTTALSSPGPVLVQSHGGGAGCTSSNNVTLSSQPAAGDLIVIYAQLNNTSVKLSAPSGFSTKDTKTGSWFQAAEYYKIAMGSEGTTYAVGSTCTGNALTWVVADVRGENQSNPFDQHNSTVTSATGISKFTTATLTPSQANDLPIAVIAPGSNGLTVSSIAPSTWGLGATGAYYTQKFYAGPVTGTTALNFSETTASSTSWASLATLDLIEPAGGTSTTATAAPTTTATPSPTPTQAPVSSTGSTYTFHGVQVYPSCDWFTTPLNVTPSCSSYALSTVDPNSGNIINNFDASSVCGGSCKLTLNASTVSVEYGKVAGNVATSSTPLYTVSGCAYGCADDPYGDNPKHQIPFTSAFLGQGNCSLNNSCAGCKGISGCYTSPPYSECQKDDCHVVVVNSSTGIDYETYVFGSFPFNGSSYNAESLATYNLKQPYHASGSGATAAGLPLLGTDDMGEDASLPSINHVAYMVLPGSDGSSVAAGGHVAPASAGPGCVSSCTNKLPFGARLRLKSSYTCPSPATNPQANKICTQLKSYGMIVMDHGTSNGTFQIELGESSNGSNPWNSSDLSAITGIPLSDFEVMTLGTVY